MRLQFIGSGDAFGSGSRFNTFFDITGARTDALIDCGASSLIALKRAARPQCDQHFWSRISMPIISAGFRFSCSMRNWWRSAPAARDRRAAGLPGWYYLFAATFPGERTLPFPLTLREVEIGKPKRSAT